MTEQTSRRTANKIAHAYCDKQESIEGGIIHKGFIFGGDRYRFDFNLCLPFNGWKQYDTDQDAWYFGCWVNVIELSVVSYVEGDVYSFLSLLSMKRKGAISPPF